MTASLYHSATGVQAPHCMHVVGVGRTGAGYVEALLRTGEIEDLLQDPRARFAALVVDIGDQDMEVVRDYASSFYKRLESRVFRPIGSCSSRSPCRFQTGTNSLKASTARGNS